MYDQQENLFYYITAYKENYLMPAIPKKNVEADIVAGGYLFSSTTKAEESDIHLPGSGSIMQQVLDSRSALEQLGFNQFDSDTVGTVCEGDSNAAKLPGVHGKVHAIGLHLGLRLGQVAKLPAEVIEATSLGWSELTSSLTHH